MTADPDDDEQTFSAASYALAVPETDGLRADKITIRSVGVIDLDRTSIDELEFVDASLEMIERTYGHLVSGAVDAFCSRLDTLAEGRHARAARAADYASR